MTHWAALCEKHGRLTTSHTLLTHQIRIRSAPEKPDPFPVSSCSHRSLTSWPRVQPIPTHPGRLRGGAVPSGRQCSSGRGSRPRKVPRSHQKLPPEKCYFRARGWLVSVPNKFLATKGFLIPQRKWLYEYSFLRAALTNRMAKYNRNSSVLVPRTRSLRSRQTAGPHSVQTEIL